MFDMRRRDEAEGESRMIGSGRRAGVLRLCDNVVEALAEVPWAARRALNGIASFLT